MDKELEELKQRYDEIPIPAELDVVVQQALKRSTPKRRRMNWLTGAAASALLLTTLVNTTPTIAQSLAGVPLIGSVIELITFREFVVDEGTYQANIQVPALRNLDNKLLESTLNEKYLAENKQLYEQFMAEMENIKVGGGGYLGIDSGYEIKTDTEQILAIGRYVVNTVGSSSTTFTYDTIDKQNELLITLPSLFKDEGYVKTISDNIKQQMREQMQTNGEKVYWVTDAGLEEEALIDTFESIAPAQNFYINADHKLVISFDKYEVAPGYMGVIEFVIPTEIIANDLVSHEYIK